MVWRVEREKKEENFLLFTYDLIRIGMILCAIFKDDF